MRAVRKRCDCRSRVLSFLRECQIRFTVCSVAYLYAQCFPVRTVTLRVCLTVYISSGSGRQLNGCGNVSAVCRSSRVPKVSARRL